VAQCVSISLVPWGTFCPLPGALHRAYSPVTQRPRSRASVAPKGASAGGTSARLRQAQPTPQLNISCSFEGWRDFSESGEGGLMFKNPAMTEYAIILAVVSIIGFVTYHLF
jgi:hypothetical protein